MKADIDASKLKITLTESPKPLKPLSDLSFGNYFTDHMLCIKYSESDGWSAPEIKPYAPLSIDPAANVLNYSVETFEGMKAYRCTKDKSKINLFRPDKNMARLSRSSTRIMLPQFDNDEMIKCIKALVNVDQRFVPDEYGYSLYIRPNFIGTEPNLNLQYSREAMLYVILSPVGPYFPKTVKLWATSELVRAWPNGVGSYKLGGNYAPAMRPAIEAIEKGYDQILWLLGEDNYVTEVGSMNFFILWKTEDGTLELTTAPLDGIILPGITRDSLLEIARKWGEFKVSERKFTMKDVRDAVEQGRVLEAFGAGTACVVCSVEQIMFEGSVYKIPVDPSDPKAVFGPVADRLRKALLDIQYGNTESEWAVPTL